jgi:glutaredoxin 3
MGQVVIYTTDYCSFCARAKALLRSKGVSFEEIDLSHDPSLREEVQQRTGRRTVPQIFIDGVSVGGFDEIRQLDEDGELDRMLGIGR